MTYHYVLTLQLRGYDPITYKGTCVPRPGTTSSQLLDFITGEALKSVGRPSETQYSIICWFVGPEALTPEEVGQ